MVSYVRPHPQANAENSWGETVSTSANVAHQNSLCSVYQGPVVSISATRVCGLDLLETIMSKRVYRFSWEKYVVTQTK